MKKKIALLLASVMALTTVPMNLFAASENTLVNQSTVVPEKNLFAQTAAANTIVSQERSTFKSVTSTAGATIADGINISEVKTGTSDDVKYVTSAAVVKIKLGDSLQTNASIAVNLTGAEWFFRDENHTEKWPNNATINKTAGTVTFSDISGQILLGNAKASNINSTWWNTPISSTTITPAQMFNTSLTGAQIINGTPLVYNYSFGAGATYDPVRGYWERNTNFSANKAVGGTFYNGIDASSGYGSFIPDGMGGTSSAVANAPNPGDSTSTTTNTASVARGTVGSVAGAVNMNGNVPYILRVNESDATRATVQFPEGGRKDEYVMIPIVARVTEKSDVKVDIVATNLSSIQSQSFVFGRADSRLTTAYVDEIKTFRDEIDVNKLVVKESRIGSMKNGSFTLTLPNGLEWADVNKARVFFEYGLNGTGATGTVNYTHYSNTGYNNSSYDEDASQLTVSVSGMGKSTIVPGSIYITGLRVVAEDDSTYWGDVNVTIEETNTLYNGKEDPNGKNEVTKETFVIAKRVQYSYDFKLEGDVRTLVNGRYENYDSSRPKDEYHYLGSKILFKELTANTWHAERESTFTLPEWAKIRKLEITDAEKFEIDNTDNTNENTELKEPRVGTIPVYEIESSTGRYASAGTSSVTEAFGTNFYPSDYKQHNRVMVTGNEIKIKNLHIDQDEKAMIKFKLWLSLESGKEGDVTLTAGGAGIREEVAPIVIAKSVNPVKVETKITDVKIGLQFQSTADVRVTETAAGYLLKGKTVKLSLSDAISEDMVFTPGYSVSVEAGDLKIKDIRVTANSNAYSNTIANNGQGTIALDISAGSTKASTILYKNMQVKITRDVPQSNLNLDKNFIGYDVVAWGSAIAENYGSKGYDRNKSADMFPTAGIGANYLRVVTTATGRDTTLSTVVKVTIGDPVIQVGPTTYTMDTAAYISEKSNSTMIPLRFVSVALGIPEDSVIWSDAEHSVTIINAAGGTSVKFFDGDSNMIVNGNKVPMVSPDGLPVALEIKDERSFVPFRALGTALGIQVTWDEETQTAIFNAENAK